MHAPADMAELVDAPVSGTGGSNALEVQVLLSAPRFWGCSSVDRALRSHRRGRVVAQLIERYVRIVEVVGLSPISSTKIFTAVRRFFIDKYIPYAVVYCTDFQVLGIWRNGRR